LKEKCHGRIAIIFPGRSGISLIAATSDTQHQNAKTEEQQSFQPHFSPDELVKAAFMATSSPRIAALTSSSTAILPDIIRYPLKYKEKYGAAIWAARAAFFCYI